MTTKTNHGAVIELYPRPRRMIIVGSFSQFIQHIQMHQIFGRRRRYLIHIAGTTNALGFRYEADGDIEKKFIILHDANPEVVKTLLLHGFETTGCRLNTEY